MFIYLSVLVDGDKWYEEKGIETCCCCLKTSSCIVLHLDAGVRNCEAHADATFLAVLRAPAFTHAQSFVL